MKCLACEYQLHADSVMLVWECPPAIVPFSEQKDCSSGWISGHSFRWPFFWYRFLTHCANKSTLIVLHLQFCQTSYVKKKHYDPFFDNSEEYSVFVCHCERMCVRVCVSEWGQSGNTAVELRRFIYVAIYLNKLHFLNVWPFDFFFLSTNLRWKILCTVANKFWFLCIFYYKIVAKKK